MADWATISSLATAGGTLILAVATFSSVRSANRAARTAERALEIGLRPVLAGSRPHDPALKVRWGDNHWAALGGGQAVVDVSEAAVYLAISLRNVGAGMAVIHGWRVWPEAAEAPPHHPPLSEFRAQLLDLYVPSGDTGYWLAAVRTQDDALRGPLTANAEGRRQFYLDLLYGDHEGGQRTVSRFVLSPREADDAWTCGAIRHWNVDRRDPR